MKIESNSRLKTQKLIEFYTFNSKSQTHKNDCGLHR